MVIPKLNMNLSFSFWSIQLLRFEYYIYYFIVYYYELFNYCVFSRFYIKITLKDSFQIGERVFEAFFVLNFCLLKLLIMVANGSETPELPIAARWRASTTKNFWWNFFDYYRKNKACVLESFCVSLKFTKKNNKQILLLMFEKNNSKMYLDDFNLILKMKLKKSKIHFHLKKKIN